MPFVPFEGPYSNHIGSCRHPVTGVIYMAVTFHPNGQGPYNLQIWAHDPPYNTAPVKIREWVQGGAESPGPFGYCTLECMFDGSLWIGVAGGVQSAGSIVPATRVEPNCCAPFQPQGAGQAGPAGPQGPKGDTGPAGPVGPAGGASGGLSPEDVEALRRLKAWLGI
jgi:hypothetical protein